MDNVPSFIHRVNNRRTRISLPRIGFPRINDFGPTITATEPPAQVFISVDTDDWRWTVYRALPHGERRNILQYYLAAPVRREQYVGLSDSVQLWIEKRQYMNFANFIILLERTIRNAGGAGVELNQLASTIAQPTEGLLSSYASIAAKVAREETLQGARELWELAQSDAAFRSRLSMLHCRLMAQSGSVPVPCQQVRSRLHYLHTNISMSLKTVIDEVERAGDAAINPLFIRWLDVSITGALLYIPVVGPALSDVHNNLFAGLKKLVLDMAASRAPQDSVAFASRAPAEAVAGVFAATTSHITSGLSQASSTFSAASQRLRPVQGLASLVYGALSYAVTRQGDVVLSHNYPCAPVYAASLTQSLRRHESRHQTLAHFRDHTDVVFQSIEQYIDRTVQQQLDQTLDDIARRWQPDAPPGIKKTLILMGYFYGKRTRSLQGQGRAQQGGANLANGMGRATFTQSSNTDNAPPSAARRAHLQALSHNPQMTAMQQAAVADVKLLASKPMLLSFANTEDLMASVEAYSARLKYAAYADIDQALQRSSFPLTHDDRLALWRLCVGAQLIVSHALNDARLKSHGKLNRLLAAISPTTQATPIPAHYVDLIRKAGFIVDYIGVMGYTSECRKRKFADAGKIRWSLSPSNTERALLITFSILVVSSLDIGKLLMGIHDWRTTREALAHACTTISESALAQRP